MIIELQENLQIWITSLSSVESIVFKFWISCIIDSRKFVFMFLNSMIKLLNNLCTHFIQMNNNVFLFASTFLSLFLVLTGLVAPLYAQQNQTASNMTSMEQSEGIGTASELENLTGDNTPMMQNNTDMSNTSLAEGLQAEQNTTEMTMNQTGEGAQTAMNQTGEGAQTAMNQTGEGAQAAHESNRRGFEQCV